MLETKKIKYKDGDVILEGYCAYQTSSSGKRPAVLVVHDWSGRNEFAEKKAKKLADLGFVGFALDMYGEGRTGKNNEEKTALMQPLVSNRVALRARILSAYETVKQLPNVDSDRIGVMGFCFGGLCALDLARSGVPVRGAISFHGLLSPPENVAYQPILAKILVLHGHDDPMVPPEQVLHFEKEMTKAGVDWQVHVYGNTMHAFTNPQALDPGFGTVYNEIANKRAFVAMQNFFEEVLS